MQLYHNIFSINNGDFLRIYTINNFFEYKKFSFIKETFSRKCEIIHRKTDSINSEYETRDCTACV